MYEQVNLLHTYLQIAQACYQSAILPPPVDPTALWWDLL